ncbi:unnamed protein product [Ilex paraguariensis]|uniref:Uncharacterized protein n=1 Tax=Ilex paraguariensis TaxID=185542 RepID=A0ABC8TAW9_9AQUA
MIPLKLLAPFDWSRYPAPLTHPFCSYTSSSLPFSHPHTLQRGKLTEKAKHGDEREVTKGEREHGVEARVHHHLSRQSFAMDDAADPQGSSNSSGNALDEAGDTLDVKDMLGGANDILGMRGDVEDTLDVKDMLGGANDILGMRGDVEVGEQASGCMGNAFIRAGVVLHYAEDCTSLGWVTSYRCKCKRMLGDAL